MVQPEFAEAVVPGGDSSLGGVPAAPEGRIEGPPDLDARPVDADRVVEAGPPHEPSGRPLLERPEAGAAQFPLAENVRHLRPGGIAVERTREVQPAPHLGRAHHGEVVVEVVIAKRAQDETLGLDGRTRAHCHILPAGYSARETRAGVAVGPTPC